MNLTTPDATYAWILRHIAAHIWITNKEVAAEGTAWAADRGLQFPSVSNYANRAREALGIVSLGRSTGTNRPISIDPIRYEALCDSLDIAPRYTPGTIKIQNAKVRRNTRTGCAKPIRDSDTTPESFTHRGVRCRVVRSRGVHKDGSYGWVGMCGTNYVWSGRAVDAAEVQEHLDALTPAKTPVQEPVQEPANGVLDNPEEAIMSLAALAWEVMAAHGITRLDLTPDSVNYDVAVTVTRTLGRNADE